MHAVSRPLAVAMAATLFAACAAPSPRPVPPRPPGDRAPALDLSSRVQPIYPGFDVVYALGGTTVLDAIIADTGAILAVRVERSSGHREIDDAALAAVRQWRFAPGNKDGHRVGGVVRIPLDFSPQPFSALTFNPLWPSGWAHPDYVVDQAPIRFGSVDAALNAVAAEAHRSTTGIPEIKQFQIRDAKGTITAWWIFTDLDTPDAMATRLVFGGTTGDPVVEVASLCTRAVVCETRQAETLQGPSFARSP